MGDRSIAMAWYLDYLKKPPHVRTSNRKTKTLVPAMNEISANLQRCRLEEELAETKVKGIKSDSQHRNFKLLEEHCEDLEMELNYWKSKFHELREHRHNEIEEKDKIKREFEEYRRAQETQEKEERLRCPICFEDLIELKRQGKTLASTACGHLFCMADIKAAAEQMFLCPTCSNPLSSGDYHPIYIM